MQKVMSESDARCLTKIRTVVSDLEMYVIAAIRH